MNAIKFGIWLFMLFALAACGGGSGDGGSPNAPASNELQVGQTRQGYIDTDEDVDIYRIRANEYKKYMLIKCTEVTSGSGVDLLVTVYEEKNGKRMRKFGKHKPEGAGDIANLDLWVYIQEAGTDLVIEVRDLKADDHNTKIPYFLTCSYQESVEGNHDFSTATELTVGEQGLLTDSIAEGGEVDTFTFDVQSDGVYALKVDHKKPGGQSEVQLAVRLYDKDGNRVMKIVDPDNSILAYLDAANGPYFISVEDADSMDGDTGAPYDISVVAVAAGETNGNDDKLNADGITPDGQGTYTATGAIEYAATSAMPGQGGDKDWYSFTVGTPGGATTYHPLKMTIDDASADNGSAKLRVTVLDSKMNPVTGKMDPVAYYDFKAGSDAYVNQIRLTNGEYFIMVEPAGANKLTQGTTYQVQLSPVDINDEGEVGDSNKQDDDNPLLTAGTPVNGFVSYIADVDWYRINVDPNQHQVLSVNLTSDVSPVDYHVSIWLGTTELKRASDLDGSDRATHLKTSVLIPAGSSTEGVYHIKVSDSHNNDGSGVPYTLTANISNIGDAPGGIAETDAAGEPPLEYYSETGDELGLEDEVEVEIFSSYKPKYKYNKDLLDFRAPGFTGTKAPGPAAGTTVITSPWISGYADYQGDRDVFQLDFDKLDPNGAETKWYYDVEVLLVVPGATSVEYVWKLYLDHNRNNIIRDQASGFNQSGQLTHDYYKACAGDTTPQLPLEARLVLETPTGDEEFWIGSKMSAGSEYFFSIGDFDYWKLPGTGTPGDPASDLPNPNPDDDWSYEDATPVPYYFKITLTYHPGKENPYEP